eukprot:TRINITY_DN79852_c0_g1_i1.p1 TRINITY_DN79852_c0_g1~~TRINITY_DN79852_c0_g1_i1.p1  ORF type:complete len:402 (-),score=53.18 TRINITY_DN79852_c0_g1_i1:57-1262(-)
MAVRAAVQKSSQTQQLLVALLAFAVVGVGSLNNVLSQIRSVPLGKYNYITAVLNSIVYALIWGLVVIIRVALGYTSPASVRYVYSWNGAWRLLALAGLGDVFGQVLGFVAQPHLALPEYSLSNQFLVFFTVIFSVLILRVRYIFVELLGVVIAVCGIVVLIVSKMDHGPSQISFMVITACGTAGNALSFVLKEKTFRGFSEHAQSCLIALRDGDVVKELLTEEQSSKAVPQTLDVFVVSSCTSLFSLLFVVPMIPVNMFFTVTSDGSFWTLFAQGLACLANVLPDESSLPEGACVYAWQSWVAYMLANLAYNLLFLLLVRQGSALLGFLALKILMPCSVLLSMVAWHFGPITLPAAAVGFVTWVSLFLVLLGVCVFRWGNVVREKLPPDTATCCWPVFSKH